MIGNRSHAESYLGIPLSQVEESHLLRLFRCGESLTLEFKRFETLEKKSRDRLGKTVSAFANSEGGLLIIGMKPDGLDWGKVQDWPKDQVEDVVISKVDPRPTLDCHQILNRQDPKLAIYIVEVHESERVVMFDGAFYHRKGSKSMRMEQYEVESAFNVRRRPCLKLKLYKFGEAPGSNHSVSVYVCLFNAGRGAAHHPFFLGQTGQGMQIEDPGSFKVTSLRGGTNSFQWLGSNITIPTGVGVVMSELNIKLSRDQDAYLRFFIGADGIEPTEGRMELPQELLSVDRSIPLLVSLEAKLT